MLISGFAPAQNFESDTAPNSLGGDSVITINPTIVNTSVSQNGLILTANTSEATYQWVDCDNSFAMINGEINQNYTATANGNYAVVITENGCTDTSSCHFVMVSGIIENDFESGIFLHPNPTKGDVCISLGRTYQKIIIKVTDLSGRMISTELIKGSDQVNVNLIGTQGVYLIIIKTADHSAILKVVKE